MESPRKMTGSRRSPDPRDIPNYSLTESARWLGLNPATARSWFVGTTYRADGGRSTRFKGVIEPAATGPVLLSFWNLVELSVLASMRNTHGISFQKVRKALNFVEKHQGRKRPLIHAQFETDGLDLFVEHYEKLLTVSQGGQVVLRDLLSASLTRIECDADGLAARLYPWTHQPTEPKVVAIDPRVSFGRPTLASTGVPVEAIMERFRAGDKIGHLAADYQIEQSKVEDLVRWAAGAAAAA